MAKIGGDRELDDKCLGNLGIAIKCRVVLKDWILARRPNSLHLNSGLGPRHGKILYLNTGRDDGLRRAVNLRDGGALIMQNIVRNGSGQKVARRRAPKPASFGIARKTEPSTFSLPNRCRFSSTGLDPLGTGHPIYMGSHSKRLVPKVSPLYLMGCRKWAVGSHFFVFCGRENTSFSI